MIFRIYDIALAGSRGELYLQEPEAEATRDVGAGPAVAASTAVAQCSPRHCLVGWSAGPRWRRRAPPAAATAPIRGTRRAGGSAPAIPGTAFGPVVVSMYALKLLTQ
jgi:hypothetical protein